MSAFKRISKSDIVTVPYVANKQWDFSYLNINSSSIFMYTGVKMSGSFSPSTEPMTTNSQYQRLVYDSINHQFYHEYSGSLLDTSGLLKSYNYESASQYMASGSYPLGVNMSYGTASFPQNYGDTIAVLSIPSNVYGDSISPSTFTLSSSAYYITDDGYGNLKDGNTFVGNIFYPNGIAVITNQSYQTYFTDTTTTVVNWSNFSSPLDYFIDSNLKIDVNGQERLLEYGNNNGRFTLNVGDTVYVETWSDGTWPFDGTASLHLSITGQPAMSTSESGGYLSSSFVVVDQTPIYIKSYTAYTPDVQPYTIIWNFNEYQEGGTVLIDDSLTITSADYLITYLSKTSSGTGTVTIPAGDPIRINSSAITTEGSGSTWGSYVSASAGQLLKQGATTIYSSSYQIGKDTGVITSSNLVSLSPGTTYTLTAGTGNPELPIAPATINWSMQEYEETGSVFIDSNFKIQTVGGGTVILDQLTGGTGSVTVPADTNIELYAYSYTNDATASYWNNYVSASLSASISQSGDIISQGSVGISRNTGTREVYAIPSVTVQSGETYHVNVFTAPTLMPLSMSFSSMAVGGIDAYIDNQGFFSNGVTSPWYMSWDRTLMSGELQPEDSTYAPFAFSGVPFTAKSIVNGATTTWGLYTSCSTVIDVYENGILIASGSAQLDSGTYPTTGSWNVETSVVFTPVSGSVYILNAYNANLNTGSSVPFYTYILGYDSASCSPACADFSITPVTMYSPTASLTVGSELYSNSSLTVPAIPGKYSNGTNCYTVAGGLITVSGLCTPAGSITSSFAITADAGNSGSLDIYTESPSGSGFILSHTLYTGESPHSVTLLPGDNFYTTVTHTARATAPQRGQITTVVDATTVDFAITPTGSLPQTASSAVITIVSGSSYNVYALLGDQV